MSIKAKLQIATKNTSPKQQRHKIVRLALVFSFWGLISVEEGSESKVSTETP